MKKNIVYGLLILLAFLAITLTVILVMRAHGFEERVRRQDITSGPLARGLVEEVIF